ncbi:zinc transporter ZIP1-like [Physella acuta]|uniref:zinc transporter ZIP1-like n=1 Tax=Physella acuta TaxID=109671 RepID=UPI0027DDB84C|nr:zinc transporter ZIP1-like [Physella acuta]
MEETGTKGLCLVLLFLDTLLFGLPPYLLVRESSQTGRSAHIRALVISYLTCFAGGVFLGACLLHLLAEGRESMENYFKEVNISPDFPVFEAVSAIGFFLIALVEELAHKFLMPSPPPPKNETGPLKERSKSSVSLKNHIPSSNEPNLVSFSKSRNFSICSTDQTYNTFVNPNYVANNAPKESSTPADTAQAAKGIDHGNVIIGLSQSEVQKSTSLVSNKNERNKEKEASSDNTDSALVDALETLPVNPLRAFLLLGALSFHTIFDGLAVGLQTDVTSIWEMFAAIFIHKSLVALCLGMQLFLVFKSNPLKAFVWIFIFALISPVGVGLGMGLTSSHIDQLAEGLVSWILQAIATGTFMYVTFFEILREELAEKRGLLRLALVILGFGGMALAKFFDRD